MTDESYKLQLGVIMKNLSKVKREKIEIAADNISLKEACKSLKARLGKSERHKHSLISMFKQRVVENDDKIQSLRRENNNLQTTVQEQNQTIEEHLNTIGKLKEENEKLRKENELLKYQEQARNIGNRSMNTTLPVTNAEKRIKVINNQSVNFNHPSFQEEVKKINKKKKLKPLSQFRWANLDIQVKGQDPRKEFNSSDSSTKLNASKEKKRKLYSQDDATVDLTNEED